MTLLAQNNANYIYAAEGSSWWQYWIVVTPWCTFKINLKSCFSQSFPNLASIPTILLWLESWNNSTSLVYHCRDFLHKNKIYNTTREKTLNIILLKYFFHSLISLSWHWHKNTACKSQHAINELSMTGWFTGRNKSVYFFWSSGFWSNANSTRFLLSLWHKTSCYITPEVRIHISNTKVLNSLAREHTSICINIYINQK